MPLSRISSNLFSLANNYIAQNQGLITGTANGAITISKGVLLNPDGSFTEVSGTNPASGNSVFNESVGGTAFSTFDSFLNTSTDGIRNMAILGDPRSTTNGVMYYATTSGSDIRVRSIWIDPNNPATANYGVPTTIAASTSAGQGAELVWHAANNLFLGMAFEGNQSLGVRTVNVAVGNTVTVGSVTTVTNIYDTQYLGPGASANYANTGAFSAFHDSSTSRTIIGCYDSATRYPQVLVANVAGATITFGAKTVIESVQGPTASGQAPKMYGCFDPTSNKSVFLYTASSLSRMNLVVATTDASSNIVTLGTPITLPRCNAALHFGITANPNTGKVIIASSNLIYEYSVSGTSLNLDATYDSIVASTAYGEIDSNGVTRLQYDIKSKNYTAIGFSRTGTNNYQVGPYGIVFKKNKIANNYVLITYVKPQSDVGLQSYFGTAFTKIGNSSNNYIMSALAVEPGCVNPTYRMKLDTFALATTNEYDEATFVGFSSNTYTSGQTATVYYANSGGLLVSNNINLLAGSPYFIDYTNTYIEGSANTTNIYKVVGRTLANNQLAFSG